MIGSYELTEKEVEVFKPRLENSIKLINDEVTDVIDITHWLLSPANIIDLFKQLGYEKRNFETNGWEPDVWYYFVHPEIGNKICFQYNGYTFNMELIVY